MIIAAFAGTGKTHFSTTDVPAVYLDIIPYKFIIPPDESALESEAEKGILIINPDFPENYILAVLQAELKHKYAIIPSDIKILDILLELYGRKVVLLYPSEMLQDDLFRLIRQPSSQEKLEHFALNDQLYFSNDFSDIPKITEYVDDAPPRSEDMEWLKDELSVPRPLILMDYDEKGENFYTRIYVDSSEKRKEVYDFGRNYCRVYEASPFQMDKETISIMNARRLLKELDWQDFKRKTLPEYYHG